MIYEGKFIGKDLKIGIINFCFNEFIILKFLLGVEDCFLRYDVFLENIEIVWVFGVFEIFFVV